MNEVLLGDSTEVLQTLIDDGVRVDLTVTSPPYDSMRSYNETLVWGQREWERVLSLLYEITKDGGVVVWNVNDSAGGGSETGNSFRQALFAMDLGFNLHDTMIWKKTNPFNFGSQYAYIQSFEYMFIFSKGRPKTINFIEDRLNKGYEVGKTKFNSRARRLGDDIQQTGKTHELKRFGRRYNVWEYPTSTKSGLHKATFPDNLAKDHILSWSNEGDLVLDPFSGSGTTCIQSLLVGRNFIGIEKVKEFHEDSVQRIFDAKIEQNKDLQNQEWF